MSLPAAQRIGLGTAQFGLDYGITNPGGRVAEGDVRVILADCAAAGIDTLDTASLYGESEAAIGRTLEMGADFRIVTKTPKFTNTRSPVDAICALNSAFEASLHKLQRVSVHALLLHDVSDLLGPFGGALWEAMEALKASGRVTKIGVSIYEGAEIENALLSYPIDIVQLPWNPIDSRLIASGTLANLAAKGLEIHARSLFLQGLLLQQPAAIPKRFGPVREAVEDLDVRFRKQGVSRLEGILAAAFARPEISRFICGVTNRVELDAIVVAAQTAHMIKGSNPIPTYRGFDPRYLDPRRWPDLV
jgi:aryl-alcohol dehydrogenase-like predicted oxidoreductase